MSEITIQRAAINMEALDEALRAALAGAVAGLSFNGSQVRVHLSDAATPADQDTARAIVQTHDATVLTATQQARLDRESALATLRMTEGALLLDTSLYAGETALIQALACKIVWLEHEINTLRA